VPAMTYSRAGRTTIGPGCLSAVFGMGTGVSTRAWSPAVSVRGRAPVGVRPPRCTGARGVRGVACVPAVRWVPRPRPLSRVSGGGAVRPNGRLLVPVG
jgi:hypothetical protein